MKCPEDDCGLDVPKGHPNEAPKDDFLEVAKSFNAIALQAIKSGQEITERKYKPLLDAVKLALSDKSLSDGTREELQKAVAQLESRS